MWVPPAVARFVVIQRSKLAYLCWDHEPIDLVSSLMYPTVFVRRISCLSVSYTIFSLANASTSSRDERCAMKKFSVWLKRSELILVTDWVE